MWAVVIVISLAALALSAVVGWALVKWVFQRISPAPTPGVLRGGTWIGVLERVLITGGILVGMPEVIAVVIAVKGLGRYPELRETDDDLRGGVAERFIIGTLTSFLVAAAIGVGGRALILAIS
ncbi:hypothetical protein [Demequina sp.]|uniref:hypothetical protein n=1 Tax=Demequina sp. TaxID=2050685 RepID=UPI003D0AFC44